MSAMNFCRGTRNDGLLRSAFPTRCSRNVSFSAAAASKMVRSMGLVSHRPLGRRLDAVLHLAYSEKGLPQVVYIIAVSSRLA